MEKTWNKLVKLFLVIYILGSLIYIPFITFKKVEEIRQINIEKGEILIKSFRNKVEFLQMVMNNFREIEGVSEYSKEDNEDFYITTKIFNKIKNKNNFYGKMGYEISLFKEGEKKIITSEGTQPIEEFYEKLGITENNKIAYSKNKETLGIIFKDTNYLREGKLNWIISIDKKIFFSEFNLGEKGEWYLRKNEKYFPLGDEKELKRLQSFSINKEVNDLLIKDFKGDISVYPEPILNSEIIYIHPRHSYLKIFLTEFLKILFILILILMGKRILEKIQKNYQQKIKKIGEIAENLGYQESSSRENEEGIENRMKYIQEYVKELKNDNFQNHLRDFILGTSSKKIEDEMIKNTFSKENKVILIQIFDIEIEFELENFKLGKEYFKEKDQFYKMVDLDYKSFILITDESQSEKSISLSEEIIKIFQDKFNTKVVIGISKESKGINELPKLYREAKKILDYKFIIKGSGVISEEKILQVGKISNYYYSLELEAKLVSKTLSGNVIGVKKLIGEIFEDKYEDKILDSGKFKEFSRQLQNTLSRIFSMLENFHTEKTLDEINLKRVETAKEIDELKEIFAYILLDICKITKSEEQNDNEIVKAKIQTYMENNYMKDISLENLADYLGHSFKYTSILFKKIMGENFKNSLDLYRIEKSKELMERDSELKIKDIAEMVGCNSSNTFIRMFRRYTGVSPGKYLEIEE